VILQSALDLFVEGGFDGVPISQIAERAGVSKAAVSFHFPSKELLVGELVEPLLADLEQAIGRHERPTWPDGAWELFADCFEVMRRHQAVATWIDADKSTGTRSYRDRLDRATDRVVSALTRGSRSPRLRIRALAAVGGLWLPLRTLSADEIQTHRDEILHAALVSYAPLDPPTRREAVTPSVP
jgi:AcrR family transcriptional regulator